MPVLCLAQLNRQAEVSRDNRPRLSHLREVGRHRAGRRRGDVRPPRGVLSDRTRKTARKVAGQADLIIAKQRNGPIGDVKLTWLRDFTRFRDSSDRPYDEFEQFNAADEF